MWNTFNQILLMRISVSAYQRIKNIVLNVSGQLLIYLNYSSELPDLPLFTIG